MLLFWKAYHFSFKLYLKWYIFTQSYTLVSKKLSICSLDSALWTWRGESLIELKSFESTLCDVKNVVHGILSEGMAPFYPSFWFTLGSIQHINLQGKMLDLVEYAI